MNAVEAFLEAKRYCWYCGIKDHEHQSCPVKGSDLPRAIGGKNAEKAYKSCLERMRIENGTYKAKPTKHNLYHYAACQSYFCEKYQDGIIDDTFNQLKIEDNNNQNIEQKLRRGYSQFCTFILGMFQKALVEKYEEKYNDFEYSSIIKRYRSKGNASPWIHSLNSAVKTGIPADFSSAIKNRIYTIEKVTSRPRYLFHLLMDSNPVSNAVRSMLLGNREQCCINIYSIGGGPGFDHIAIWLVILFLRNVNHRMAKSDQPACIRTKVFDLYNEWSHVCLDVEKCFSQLLQHLGDSIQVDVYSDGGLSFHQCDLRLDLCDVANSHLLDNLSDVDIICLQYVMHENSSFISHDNDSRIRGLVQGILIEAKEGTVMIFTDSVNFLWSKLRVTATEHSWVCFGSDDMIVRSKGSPKSFVMLLKKRK